MRMLMLGMVLGMLVSGLALLTPMAVDTRVAIRQG